MRDYYEDGIFSIQDVINNERIRKRTIISSKYMPYFCFLAVFTILYAVVLDAIGGIVMFFIIFIFFRAETTRQMRRWREGEQRLYKKQWGQYLYNQAFEGVDLNSIDRLSYNEFDKEFCEANKKLKTLFDMKKINTEQLTALTVPYLYQFGLFKQMMANNSNFNPDEKVDMSNIYMCRLNMLSYDDIKKVKYRASKNIVLLKMLKDYDFWMGGDK